MKGAFSSFLFVYLALPFALNVETVFGCLNSLNVTLDQLLEGRPHLKAFYSEFEPSGFLSEDGLRSLISRLLFRTASHKLSGELEHHSHHDHHPTDDHHEDHDHHDHGHTYKEKLPKINGKLVESRFAKHEHGSEGRETDHGHVGSTVALPAPSLGLKDCDLVENVIANAGFNKAGSLAPEGFLFLCPSILETLLSPPCPRGDGFASGIMDSVSSPHGDHDHSEQGYDHSGHNHHHRHAKDDVTQMSRDAWIAAVLSMLLIGLIALMCIMIIPVLKQSKYYVAINHFLLALAIGSLAGDALIHLLPHAMTMQIQMGLSGHLVHAMYGFTAFLGILLFLLMERLHNLMGHRHSHSHDAQSTMDGDELIKEIGIISAELNEPNAQHFDKIGEKLSQHSKHSSFIFTDGTSPSDPPRSCFESCPPNLGSGMEDANGNSGGVMDPMVCKPRAVDHNSASLAERERLVNSQSCEKNEQISSSKTPLTSIPPPPMVQNSPPKSLIRQDSKNFNMVLQEYHIGHHGHSHHGHSHVTGKKDSLRAMILLGDGMHTFMDGMAIGAAFGTSLTGGIATAIAVLCHELPHKVGDFAILFEMGMRRYQAIKMVVLLWLLSVMGLAVGVSIGSIKEVSPWIYCFTAGVFLYLALVDLLSELSITATEPCNAAIQMALQVAGLMTGAGIMLVIAIYEHDLEYLLEGSF